MALKPRPVLSSVRVGWCMAILLAAAVSAAAGGAVMSSEGDEPLPHRVAALPWWVGADVAGVDGTRTQVVSASTQCAGSELRRCRRSPGRTPRRPRPVRADYHAPARSTMRNFFDQFPAPSRAWASARPSRSSAETI